MRTRRQRLVIRVSLQTEKCRPDQKRVVGQSGRGHYLAMNYLIAGIIGLVSGVTSGLFGVGGGVVMVPAMMLLMKLDLKVAIATSLVVIIPTALTGSIQNHLLDRINWPVAFSLVPMAMVGGWAGTLLKEQIPTGNLKQAFGGFLVLVGLKLVFFK